MNKTIKLIFEDGKEMDVRASITIRELLNRLNNIQIIALRVNGIIKDADYEIDEDAYINYITINDKIGQKIYIKGLVYVYIKAVKEVLGPKSIVYIKHSLDKGLYTEIVTKKRIDKIVLLKIKNKMKEIMGYDLPFKSFSVSRYDAYDYVMNNHEREKALNYLYAITDSVTLCELDGEYNYFYNIMPASTKILNRFDLTQIASNGVVLSYPINGSVPKYNPTHQVLESFKDSEEKIKSLGVKYTGDLNKLIVEGKISEFIQMNEIIYDQNIGSIVQKVNKDRNIRAIFISGPSSSGKTTTSKKIALFLKSRGLDTMVLSTDDYFLERKDSPKKADGTYEFEAIESLDIKLFKSHMKSLLDGEEVVIPTYNFITGEKEYKRKPIKLEENQILIVEGLHAISEKLNSVIDKKNKLKIYISPFMPLAMDRHNHIQTTDLRLIRRMVRDFNTRGYSAEETLQNWASMRKSESDYVYPYQREADIIVNTALSYELGVLKTYAEPLLFSVSKDSEYYEEAIRILRFISIFLSIPSELVPNTSVLREFIGNSYFE